MYPLNSHADGLEYFVRKPILSKSLKTVHKSCRLRMTAVLIKKRGNEIEYTNLLLNKHFCQHDGKI